MKIITKYILKEHITPFLYGVSTIAFIFLMNIVFRDLGKLIGKGLSFKVLFEFFFLNLAWIIALAIPMAVLIATLMAFGRLSDDREIDAFKASGINLYKLVFPVIVASIILTVIMVKFNDTVLPEFNYKVKMLYTDIARKRPTLTLEPNVFFDEVPGYSILVKKIEGKERILKNIIIIDQNKKGTQQTIIAEKGKVRFAEEQERIIFTLYNGEIHIADKRNMESYRRVSFPKWVLSIYVPNMSLNRSKRGVRGDREKTVSMMRKDVKRYKRTLQKKREALQNKVYSHLKNIFPERYFLQEEGKNKINRNRNRKISFYEIKSFKRYINTELLVIRGYEKSINKYRVEIEKKYSIATTCIVFVLLGASLGVLGRQGGLAVSAGLSIFFFIFHWSLLIGGEQLADRLLLGPVMAMWLPNIILGIIGIYLMIHTVRETYFIKWDRFNLFAKRQENQ